MELLDFPIRVKKGTDKVFVHVFGDIHRAALGCDYRKLRQDIAYIQKRTQKGEHHYWLGNGDFSNAIGQKDKRFDATAVAPEFRDEIGENLFLAEARQLWREFDPIKHLGIGIGEGNHERSIAKNCDFNPANFLAEKLNLPFLGYSAIVRLRVTADDTRSYTIVLYMHHGHGASRSKGAKVNMLWGLRDIVEADVYLTGHVHELLEFPEARLSVNRRGSLRLQSQELLFINNGTYLKAHPAKGPQRAGQFNEHHKVYTDYAEMKGYRPSVIGHNGFCMWNHSVTKQRKALYETRLRHVDFR